MREVPILTYHVVAVPPPKGVDRVFDHSGLFIPFTLRQVAW